MVIERDAIASWQHNVMHQEEFAPL